MVGLKELADDEIRLAGPLQSDSIVDGPGLRAVLWVSRMLSCLSRGGHNPEIMGYYCRNGLSKLIGLSSNYDNSVGRTVLHLVAVSQCLQAKACKKDS